MKKGYFITYLGAAVTLLFSIFVAGRKAKKYGQAIKPRKGISLQELMPYGEKLYDYVMDKKNGEKL